MHTCVTKCCILGYGTDAFCIVRWVSPIICLAHCGMFVRNRRSHSFRCGLRNAYLDNVYFKWKNGWIYALTYTVFVWRYRYLAQRSCHYLKVKHIRREHDGRHLADGIPKMDSLSIDIVYILIKIYDGVTRPRYVYEVFWFALCVTFAGNRGVLFCRIPSFAEISHNTRYFQK